MQEFEEIQKWCDRVHEWAGEDIPLPIKTVLARFVVPFEQGIKAMEQRKGNRWLTLEEVMTKTGWARNYFDKKLVSLGNESRLMVLHAKGLAELAAPGIWLIDPAGVPPRKPGYTPPSGSKGGAAEEQDENENTNNARPTPDVQELVNKFMGKA
jgi:hypothetical protein